VIDVPEFVDQSFLPPFIAQLKAIEEELPVIGRPDD